MKIHGSDYSEGINASRQRRRQRRKRRGTLAVAGTPQAAARALTVCYARVAGRQHERVVPRHMQPAVLRVVAMNIHSRPCRTLLDSQVRRRTAVVHPAAAALA